MFEKDFEVEAFLEEAGLSGRPDFFQRICAPSLCFVPKSGRAAERLGRSHLGGDPDLPAAIDWPMRDAYQNGKVLAEKLAKLGPELTEAFVAARPLDFLCQIDLEDVAKKRVLNDVLPADGRLLFFWDSTCGAYIDMPRSCRVIWDTSPIKALAPRASAQQERGFIHRSAQPVSFIPVWSIPDRYLLKELCEDDDQRAALDDEDFDVVWEDVMDRGVTVLASGREVLPHRLCGWPVPEQWDPRFAAVASERGVARLFEREPTDDERAECTREMHNWSLLAQFGLSDLSSDYSEGTVYFVLPTSDLKQRNFERVHAIYQQT